MENRIPSLHGNRVNDRKPLGSVASTGLNPRRPLASKAPQNTTARTALSSIVHANQAAVRVQPSRAAKNPSKPEVAQADVSNRRVQPLPAGSGALGFAAACAPAPSFDIFVDDKENFPPLQACPKLQARAPFQEIPKPKLPIVADVCSPMVVELSGDDETKQECSELTIGTQQQREQYVQQLTWYKSDIHVFLRMRELQRMPSFAAVTMKQREITPNMRTILVDWLVEVSEEYKLHRETLHLAVCYVDRFLTKASVQKSKLQLVGAACMFVAAKYEEIYPPDVGEFVYITDDTYNKKQVLRMESTVLQFLHFDVALVTGNSFLELYASELDMNEELKSHVAFLNELCLVFGDNFVSLPVSHVTCSCILYARTSRGMESWPVAYATLMGYQREELLPCVRNLHEVMTSLDGVTQRAVNDKYRADKHHNVSQCPIASEGDLL